MNTYNPNNWTYGAEHELADIMLARGLPPGDNWGWDKRDYTIVNSNGIATDPSGKLYGYGGEVNTPPTDTIDGQVDCLTAINAHWPEVQVNYRSNLHCHIRVPGLKDDLEALKRVQHYIHHNMREALAQIQPLPRPLQKEYFSAEQLAGAQRRWKRRRVSHQTLLTPKRLAHQLEAQTVEEFYKREVPQSKAGVPQWHFQPRLCVNLRQHRETDTVEFRHFAGTKDPLALETCLRWCSEFLWAALHNYPIEELLRHVEFSTSQFPAFPKYVHWQELRYRATTHDHSLTKDQIANNIQLILRGEFDEEKNISSLPR